MTTATTSANLTHDHMDYNLFAPTGRRPVDVHSLGTPLYHLSQFALVFPWLCTGWAFSDPSVDSTLLKEFTRPLLQLSFLPDAILVSRSRLYYFFDPDTFIELVPRFRVVGVTIKTHYVPAVASVAMYLVAFYFFLGMFISYVSSKSDSECEDAAHADYIKSLDDTFGAKCMAIAGSSS